jgi:acetyl esterase/lipase
MDARKLDPIPLWPGDAPDALGAGPQHTPTLTPLLPDCPGPVAAIVVCPGGGYQRCAPHEGEPVARWLCSLGVAGIVLEYRVAPYRHPAPLNDARRAMRLVRAHASTWQIDPHRVGILGFSAGGHLAVSAATMFQDGQKDSTDPVQRYLTRPDAFIACYPVITFGPLGHRGTMEALLGDNPDPALQHELSLENRVTPQTPPGFIWHTIEDPSVPVENSLLLAGSLSRCNVPFEMHLFQTGLRHHGIGLATDVPKANWTDPCARWLAKIGFIQDQGG